MKSTITLSITIDHDRNLVFAGTKATFDPSATAQGIATRVANDLSIALFGARMGSRGGFGRTQLAGTETNGVRVFIEGAAITSTRPAVVETEIVEPAS